MNLKGGQGDGSAPCRERKLKYEDMMLILIDLTELLKQLNTADWFTGGLLPGCQSGPD